MNDPQEPSRFPGEDPEQPPLIPPPRAAADDQPPRPRRRGVPAPRDGDRPHARPTRDEEPHTPNSPDIEDKSDEERFQLADVEHDRDQGPDAGHAFESEPDGERAHDDADRARPCAHPDPQQARPWHPVGPAAAGAGSTPDRGPDMWSDAVPEPPSDPDPESPPPGRPSTAEPSVPEQAVETPTTAARPPDAESSPTDASAPLDHTVLKSLLGAWALAACSAEETAAVEAHLTDCGPCAGEALRLRDAVALLHPEDNLDLDPRLRSRVLEGALGRRPPRIPIPEWAAPFDAEAARLDALLRDMAEAEWRAPVRLRWFEGERERARTATVAEVISHLMAVDGLVASFLGLPDPLDDPDVRLDIRGAYDLSHPTARTEAYWHAPSAINSLAVHAPWRDQTHALVRGVALTDPSHAQRPVHGVGLSLRDTFLDRAFECWVHAGDIAEAVDYPHPPPEGGHLHQLVELAARMLPFVLAGRRQAGLASPAKRLALAGYPGRSLHLEVEGSGGGDWYIPLDSPDSAASADGAVAHVALDGVEFCQLVAGHVSPLDAAAGAEGDPEAIRDVLFATASMSRL